MRSLSTCVGISVLLPVSLTFTACDGDPIIDLKPDAVKSISVIATEKEQVLPYVGDVKKKFKETDKAYIEAKEKYRSAAAKHNGWLDTLSVALRNNQKIDKDTFSTQAKESAETALAFISYVKEQNASPQRPSFKATADKSVLPALAEALVKAGIQIWKAYKEEQATEKERVLTHMEERLRWKPWENVT